MTKAENPRLGNFGATVAHKRLQRYMGSTATTRVVAVEILRSARKHGISDDDIRHAFTNAIASISTPDQPDFCMMVGPDQAGHLLEVGVLAADDNDYVIHAMPARPKYLNLIQQERDEP